MRRRSACCSVVSTGLLVVLCGAMSCATSRAATVEFELFTQPGAPTLATQQWYQTLTELGIVSLQIRGARSDDKMEIVTRSAAGATSYLVRGVLLPSGELIVPGGKFRQTDRARVAAWLERLRNEGPPPAPGEMRRWGLNATQLAAVRDDLARPVGISTWGVARGQIVQHMKERLSHPLGESALDPVRMRFSEPLEVELRELSLGTAWAYVLCSAGLAFEPRRNQAGQIEYQVLSLDRASDPWPVGAPSNRTPRETLPGMFEFLNAEVDSIPIGQVLEVLGERLGVTVLIDRRALEREGIDLGTVEVSFPSKRTFYADLLSKVTFQAKLKAEVRVDEADRPLLWVTTLRGK